jgi:hypothetical protein
MTLGQQLEAALRTLAQNPEGFTSQELANQEGWRRCKATQLIRSAFDQGLVEYAGRKRIVRMDNSINLVPAYRLIKQSGKPKK